MSRLIESNFIAVDLNALISAGKADKTRDNSKASSATSSANIDWTTELNRRLTANKELGPDERKSDYEIETEFFSDFYGAIWKEDVYKNQLLSIGEPLKKLFKILEFDINTNPVYKFLTLEYVKTNLLATKLINISTFKAIYNAIAKKLVAHTEFMKENDYNIIYCSDLYKKSISEIQKYLELQKNILSPDANAYSKRVQDINRACFLYDSNIKELNTKKRSKIIKKYITDKKIDQLSIPKSMRDSSAQLNSLDLIKAISGRHTDDDSAANSHMSANNMNSFVKKMQPWSPAKGFAALQYIYNTTKVPEAARALKHDVFGNLPASKIVAETTKVQNLMPKGKLPEEEVKALISIILSQVT